MPDDGILQLRQPVADAKRLVARLRFAASDIVYGRLDADVREAREAAVAWRREVVANLRSALARSEDVATFDEATRSLDVLPATPASFALIQQPIEAGIKVLDSFVKRFGSGASAEVGTPAAKPTPKPRVFVVHGHDQAMVQEVARVLERIGCEAVVLREQVDSGRTIVEKFEDEADAEFAVVLASPDDLMEGGTRRSRQNVIFELGYFYGRLGRGHVQVLRRGRVEMPSDLHGIIWTEFDDRGGWKLQLLRELKSAGLPVDLSQV